MGKILKKILERIIDEEAKRVFEFNSQILGARVNENARPLPTLTYQSGGYAAFCGGTGRRPLLQKEVKYRNDQYVGHTP